MTRKGLLKLLSIVFLQYSVCASTERHDALVPANDGETPSLPCEFTSSAAEFDRLTWTKDGIDKIVLIRDCGDTQITSCNVSVTDPGKFSVGGDLVSGVVLHVSRVTMEDDGSYECKAIILNGISIKRIRLAVLRRPTTISLLDVDKNSSLNERSIMHVVDGRHNRLNCTIPSSNPSATIAWSFGDVRVTVREQSNHSIAPGGRLMASTRAIDILPTADDEGKMISCIATHYSLLRALQKNITLNVGRLPDSPKDVAVVSASVTANSFILTWFRSSSGGNPQTYNVVYCKTLEPDQCSEITGIATTRAKIDNLRPLTFYNVELRSHNMFGYSEDNVIVEQSTKPLTPAELGIRSVYNPSEGRVDVSRPDTSLGPLPLGLCFQLVLTSSDNLVDPGAEDSDCVSVDESIPIPPGWSPKNLALVSYGNNVYSESSKIFGIAKERTGLIVGLIVAGLVAIAAGIIIYKMKKRQGNMKGKRANMRLPPQPKTTNMTTDLDKGETCLSAHYQEVDDVPDNQTNAMYDIHHSYAEGAKQAASDLGDSEDDISYSRKITKTKAGNEMDKYASIATRKQRLGEII